MTAGKIAADAGDGAVAEAAFAKLVADNEAPATMRAEALVRLGVAQRTLGKKQASSETFRKAMLNPARDAATTRLLTLALTGVAPDETLWASEWPQVKLVAAAAVTAALVQWPHAGPRHVCDAIPVK